MLDLNTDALRSLAVSLGKAGAPFAEQGLSLALSTLGGPFGGLISQGLNLIYPAINNALGLAPDTPPEQTQAAIDADPAAAQAKLATLTEDHQFQLGMAKLQSDTATAGQAQQAALLTLDTSSQSWVQRLPRPALIWGLGSLLILSGGLPYVKWLAIIAAGVQWPDPPALDTTSIGILSGLLALGVVSKSYDTGKQADAVKAIGTKAAPAKVAPVARP